MRKFLLGLLVGVILATTAPVVAANLTATVTQFSIVVNGETQQLSAAPVLIGGSTYLPLRATADLLGYNVDYSGTTRTITLTAQGGTAPSDGSAPGMTNPTPTAYRLTLRSNGLTSGAGEYTSGATVRVSTSVPDGYQFVSWKRSGQVVSTTASFNYTMPAASVTLEALFTIQTTPTASYGSRQNPIPGQNDSIIPYQEYSFYSQKTIKLELDEVISGATANQIITSENRFNKEPTASQEWRIFVFNLSYINGPANEKLEAKDVIWSEEFYTKEGNSLAVWDTATLGDRYSPYDYLDVDMYPGGSSKTVIALLVDKTAGSPLLRIPCGDDINWMLCEVDQATQTSRTVDVRTASVGGGHTLAVLNDGTLWSWGANYNATLGDNTREDRTTPVAVSGLTGIKSVSSGLNHSLALTDDGSVWAWGLNDTGQLGDGTTIDRLIPVRVGGLSNIAQISAGWDFSLALDKDGKVWAWGSNKEGKLADGTDKASLLPQKIAGITNVIAISAGGDHVLALRSDGSVWGWGSNLRGQVWKHPTQDITDKSLWAYYNPVQVSIPCKIEAVGAGTFHSVALASDGTVWAWGENVVGQLGSPDFSITPGTPCKIAGLTNVTQIGVGSRHSLALLSDGSVWAWGLNENGQLGDGTTVNRSAPVCVAGLSNVSSVSAGWFSSLAIDAKGQCYSWGANARGTLGNASKTASSSPVPVLWFQE